MLRAWAVGPSRNFSAVSPVHLFFAFPFSTTASATASSVASTAPNRFAMSRPLRIAVVGDVADLVLFTGMKTDRVHLQLEWFSILSGTSHTGRYVLAHQLTGMWTTHYRAVSPGSGCFRPLPLDIDRGRLISSGISDGGRKKKREKKKRT
ncbi:hypothetical protein BHE74_00005516 [Ensete ventricosum]|nr:hypothetical protein BHE74_00005516 [Ensete ventricosum]